MSSYKSTKEPGSMKEGPITTRECQNSALGQHSAEGDDGIRVAPTISSTPVQKLVAFENWLEGFQRHQQEQDLNYRTSPKTWACGTFKHLRKLLSWESMPWLNVKLLNACMNAERSPFSVQTKNLVVVDSFKPLPSLAFSRKRKEGEIS